MNPTMEIADSMRQLNKVLDQQSDFMKKRDLKNKHKQKNKNEPQGTIAD